MARHAQVNNVDHATLSVRTERRAQLGDAVMCCPVFPHEFRNLQAHYPILFSRQPNGAAQPVALFGFEEGSNLFLTTKGWEATYLPLVMRLQPFLIGAGRGPSGEKELEVHVDLDHPRVDEAGEEGERVFLDHGGQAPLLREAATLLGEAHDGAEAARAFGTSLEEHDLLEPFTFDLTLRDGTTGRLSGFQIIAEERLAALDGAALGRLHATGALSAVFMAVASLSRLGALAERRREHES